IPVRSTVNGDDSFSAGSAPVALDNCQSSTIAIGLIQRRKSGGRNRLRGKYFTGARAGCGRASTPVVGGGTESLQESYGTCGWVGSAGGTDRTRLPTQVDVPPGHQATHAHECW